MRIHKWIVGVSVGLVALILMPAQATAHCKWYHPHHCIDEVAREVVSPIPIVVRPFVPDKIKDAIDDTAVGPRVAGTVGEGAEKVVDEVIAYVQREMDKIPDCDCSKPREPGEGICTRPKPPCSEDSPRERSKREEAGSWGSCRADTRMVYRRIHGDRLVVTWDIGFRPIKPIREDLMVYVSFFSRAQFRVHDYVFENSEASVVVEKPEEALSHEILFNPGQNRKRVKSYHRTCLLGYDCTGEISVGADSLVCEVTSRRSF